MARHSTSLCSLRLVERPLLLQIPLAGGASGRRPFALLHDLAPCLSPAVGWGRRRRALAVHRPRGPRNGSIVARRVHGDIRRVHHIQDGELQALRRCARGGGGNGGASRTSPGVPLLWCSARQDAYHSHAPANGDGLPRPPYVHGPRESRGEGGKGARRLWVCGLRLERCG